MNYTMKHLGDICRLEYGKNLIEKDRVVGLYNVYGSNGIVGTHTAAFTSGKTIIIGRKGSIGKILISEQPCWAIDTTYFIDDSCTECDLDWLAFVLRSLNLEKLNKASGVPGLNRDDVYEKIIAVPELKSHQQLIALQLKSQLSEIEKARAATLKTKQDLQAIANKQQKTALEILNELPRVPLSDYLEGIEAGKSIKTTELPAKKDELGVLKVSAVSWDRFQPDEAKSIIDGYAPPDEHRVKKGDLIISRANTIELVGAVVLVEDDYPNRLLSDKTLRLITKNNIIPEYLLYILKMPEARKHIEDNATGTSNSMRNISQKTICTIPIPQAEEDEQREVIELMQRTRTELKKGETAIKLMLADLDLLPKKLLQEAFNQTA